MDRSALTHGRRGWAVKGLPGFEAFDVSGLRAVLINGEPTLVSVRFDPLPGDHEPAALALTPERIAAFPARKIAAALLALHETPSDGEPAWIDAMRRLNDEPMIRPRKGSEDYAEQILLFSEEVADVVRVARAQGVSSGQAIADRWNVSVPRADQYVREMRALLGERAPGDGRHERPRRGPRSVAPVDSVRRRRTTASSPIDPSARSRRAHPSEESA